MPLPYEARLGESVQSALCTGFITVPPNITVGEARSIIAAQQLTTDGRTAKLTYRYVVREDGVLVGVVPLVAMANTHDSVPVSTIAIKEKAIRTVKLGMTLHEALDTMVMHQLRALPVVDTEGKLLGVIDIQSIRGTDDFVSIDELRAELNLIAGFDQDKMRRANLVQALRLRGPWLGLTVLAGVICAVTIEGAEALIKKLPVVLSFVPLVLALGDAVCHQATSIAVIKGNTITMKIRELLKRLRREATESGILGLSVALIVALAGLIYFQDIRLVGILLFSISSAVLCGGIIGFTVPTVIERCKLDPHGAGGPISLGLADIASTLSIVGFGLLFIR